MKLLAKLIRYSPRQFVSLVGWAGVIYCLLPIPLGLATRAFFDALRPHSSGLNVWTLIGVLLALQLSEVLGEFGLVFPWSGLQQRTQSLLQHNMFSGLFRGFGRHGLPESPAAAISRFRDEPQIITSGSLDAVCDLIGRSMFAVVAAVVMWRINPTATVAAFAPVLLTAAVTDALGNRAANYGIEARQATGQVSGFVGDLVATHLAVTAGRAARRATDRLADLSNQRRRLAVRSTVFGQALNSLNFHLVHVGTGVVLLITASAIRRGTFSVGDFALFVVFLDQLTYLPAEIGRLVTELKQTQKSVDRMHGLIPGERRDALAAPAPLDRLAAPVRVRGSAEDTPLRQLSVHGLCYRYPTSGRGVSDISFTVDRGSFTVITGRIGSGKTTLLHTVLGLLPMESGEIRWNECRVTEPATFFVPPRSALTPQVPRLFTDSLRDNLQIGRQPEESALRRAVESAVLDTDVASLEDGLETLIGPRGVKLSGGQLQRSAAARMFLTEADLLVIDDLSSALDAETEAEVWRRLFRRRDVTCLVVSHRPAALRRADRILLLDNGRVVADGTLDNLLECSTAMRGLWRDQLSEGRGPDAD